MLLRTTLLTFALSSLPFIAVAQTATSSTTSGSTINQVFDSQNPTNLGSPGDPETLNESLHNTPDVLMPALPGGTNPCIQSVSGGGAGAGIGISIGGTWNNKSCEMRNWSIVLFNESNATRNPELRANLQRASVALDCEQVYVREAMAAAGTPCPRIPSAEEVSDDSAAPTPDPDPQVSAPVTAATVGAPSALNQSGIVMQQPPIPILSAPRYQPTITCHQVFVYPTHADGTPDPEGAGYLKKVCS
jgi:hypothetical protein